MNTNAADPDVNPTTRFQKVTVTLELTLEVPEGTVCIAMDEDGQWYAYEYPVKPVRSFLGPWGEWAGLPLCLVHPGWCQMKGEVTNAKETEQ